MYKKIIIFPTRITAVVKLEKICNAVRPDLVQDLAETITKLKKLYKKSRSSSIFNYDAKIERAIEIFLAKHGVLFGTPDNRSYGLWGCMEDTGFLGYSLRYFFWRLPEPDLRAAEGVPLLERPVIRDLLAAIARNDLRKYNSLGKLQTLYAGKPLLLAFLLKNEEELNRLVAPPRTAENIVLFP
ncbi:MAG: hypothetical protein LBD99_03850 [Candidatus Margulisbacteria bacterium]|jgi:hypothetical protein|nr:hypothetical protein [Candidatus Margulisiibacteriota bacterium]